MVYVMKLLVFLFFCFPFFLFSFFFLIPFPLFCFFCSGNLASDIALKAVKTVIKEENGRKEIDIKNYAKVEKVYIISFWSLLVT